MSGPSTYVPKSALGRWLESRLPIISFVHGSFIAFPVPRNLNYLWTFGAILSFMLVAQIVTGVVLAMHYTPEATMAFDSVEHIMRDVNFGWLVRYLHANGSSMFFVAVYIHMFRGLYYGSYKAPREVLWILGVIIYLLMMATAFMGYVLPWGQMSFWGATVITNLFTAIPIFGNAIATWLWGGYAIGNPTLNRFYSLHYLLPFMIAGVVVLHVWALHVVGLNNPTGVEAKNVERDTLPFTPYATVKDAFAIVCFMIFYAWFVFYIPNYLGDADNYIKANPLQTPAHIVPEWYFLPFYAILRAIPNKLLGVIALFGAVARLRLPALARHLAGEVGALPSGLSGVLLAVRRLPASASAISVRRSRPAATSSRHAFSGSTISLFSWSSCRFSACSKRRNRCRPRLPIRFSARAARLPPWPPGPLPARRQKADQRGRSRNKEHGPHQDIEPCGRLGRRELFARPHGARPGEHRAAGAAAPVVVLRRTVRSL